MEKEKASRLVDYRDMNLVQLLTKKIRLGHQETRLARSLEWALLSDTSEKDCFLQLWGQSPPLLPSLPYAVSSHSQQGAGREIGHLLSLSSSKAWSPLNIGAPRQLAPAPLCFSPLSPGNVSTLKASRYSPPPDHCGACSDPHGQQPTGQMPGGHWHLQSIFLCTCSSSYSALMKSITLASGSSSLLSPYYTTTQIRFLVQSLWCCY